MCSCSLYFYSCVLFFFSSYDTIPSFTAVGGGLESLVICAPVARRSAPTRHLSLLLGIHVPHTRYPTCGGSLFSCVSYLNHTHERCRRHPSRHPALAVRSPSSTTHPAIPASVTALGRRARHRLPLHGICRRSMSHPALLEVLTSVY